MYAQLHREEITFSRMVELINIEANNDRWVIVAPGVALPRPLQTVWVSNGKGWTTLGCLVQGDDGFHWAETNGLIYENEDGIVSECDSNDLDVRFWCELPKPPKQ